MSNDENNIRLCNVIWAHILLIFLVSWPKIVKRRYSEIIEQFMKVRFAGKKACVGSIR